MERQFEEAVHGAAAGVDSCNAGRCEHNVFLFRVFADVAQEGGLACSGFAREKHRLTGILDEFQGVLKLRIVFVDGF